VIQPLIDQARERLCIGVHALVRARSDLLFDPGAVEAILFAGLPGQLLSMLSRTMVLELHVARIQGLLKGDTPQDRFRSFVAHIRERDHALIFFQEYPVLARQLLNRIDQWVTCSLEFLQRLCADWAVIRTTFSPAHTPGRLVQVDGGAGDKHRGGRSVLIAKFSSGFQIVYKPRSLAVDRHLQQLLVWLNDRGNHPPFRTITLLDCETYGWVEFIAAHSCATSEEVRYFYERQGAYLALLYALEATDFHYENQIASGEHPMLIDLEALFQPRIGSKDSKQSQTLASQTMATP
jgi:type 2 lantibiotic biosynthesis protein LanM